MQAIPTVYRGIQMRSRLEAKWAAFFDALKWSWEYEPLDLPGWIPDFYVNSPNFNRPLLIDVKPFVGKVERPTQIKIEQALGAPLPEELRKGAPYPTTDVWHEFYQKLEYYPMVIGLRPLRNGIDVTHWAWDDTVATSGEVYLGWLLEDDMGWQLCHGAVKDEMLAAWRVATNAVQWKAPR